jgi:hypothetical protein
MFRGAEENGPLIRHRSQVLFFGTRAFVISRTVLGAAGALLLMSLSAGAAAPSRPGTCIDSPSAVLTVCVATNSRGPYYSAHRGQQQIIETAALGLLFEGQSWSPAKQISDTRRASVDRTWEQPWGEQRVIRDRHAELRVTLSTSRGDEPPFEVTFRVFATASGFAMNTAVFLPMRPSSSGTSSRSSGSPETGMPGGIQRDNRIATSISIGERRCSTCNSPRRR